MKDQPRDVERLELLPMGQPAPSGTFKAVASNRAIRLGDNDKPTVLILHDHSSAEAAKKINIAVRERYPHPGDVLVCSVIDLSAVPRVFRSFAKKALHEAFEDAAKKLPASRSAEDLVVLLPDWDGAVSASLNTRGAQDHPTVVVIDRRSDVRGIYRGDSGPAAAARFLELLDAEGQEPPNSSRSARR